MLTSSTGLALCIFLWSHAVFFSLNIIQTQWHIMFSAHYSGTLCSQNISVSSPNIIQVITSRRMTWPGHVARMGNRKGVYRVLVGRPEGQRQLGRPRHRWEDNIKMIFKNWDGGGGMDWIDLAQGTDRWWALVNVVMKLWVPQNGAGIS
jgi:hypothetical protein